MINNYCQNAKIIKIKDSKRETFKKMFPNEIRTYRKSKIRGDKIAPPFSKVFTPGENKDFFTQLAGAWGVDYNAVWQNGWGKYYTISTCGYCPACLAKKQNTYKLQWKFDDTKEKGICMVNLSYRGGEEPETLGQVKRDVKKFIDRLRSKLRRDNNGVSVDIKYQRVVEFGEKKGRRHGHIMISGWVPEQRTWHNTSKKGNKVYKSELLSKLWGNGTIQCGLENDKESSVSIKKDKSAFGNGDITFSIVNDTDKVIEYLSLYASKNLGGSEKYKEKKEEFKNNPMVIECKEIIKINRIGAYKINNEILRKKILKTERMLQNQYRILSDLPSMSRSAKIGYLRMIEEKVHDDVEIENGNKLRMTKYLIRQLGMNSSDVEYHGLLKNKYNQLKESYVEYLKELRAIGIENVCREIESSNKKNEVNYKGLVDKQKAEQKVFY